MASGSSDKGPHPEDDTACAVDDGDSEPRHSLPVEVTFGLDDNHRRRASVISADTTNNRFGDQESEGTSCFVHSLLGSRSESMPQADFPNETDKTGLEGQVGDDSSITQSRLLTKKQLSDMAWNVRTLSKKLGSLKLKLHVKSVLILTKPDPYLVESTRELTRWLLSADRDMQYTVYIENRLQNDENFDVSGIYKEEPSAQGRLKFLDLDRIEEWSHAIDILVSLGGDGTVLYASWLFQRVVPPVLSFALGTLGFLTKFAYEDYQNTLTAAFRDGITVSLRLRLECTIMRSNRRVAAEPGQGDLIDELIGVESRHDITHTPDKTFQVLNEIVVDRGPNPTMSSLEIFGDDRYFTSIQADGVCIATPTGSTAYNLAAGGSLSHPENPVVLLTAICAHTLNFRPIILPDTIVLRVGVPYDSRSNSWVSFDGRERIELGKGDYVTVTASRFPFANVMPSKPNQDWIDNISRTLNWNIRQKQISPTDEKPPRP